MIAAVLAAQKDFEDAQERLRQRDLARQAQRSAAIQKKLDARAEELKDK